MSSALIYILKAGEKLNLSSTPSVREEGSPYSSCGWIPLSQWTGECFRAAVRGWADFVQSCRCSVQHTPGPAFVFPVFFFSGAIQSLFLLKTLFIDMQFSEMLRKLYWRVFWWSILSPNIFRVQVWTSFRSMKSVLSKWVFHDEVTYNYKSPFSSYSLIKGNDVSADIYMITTCVDFS